MKFVIFSILCNHSVSQFIEKINLYFFLSNRQKRNTRLLQIILNMIHASYLESYYFKEKRKTLTK